MALVALIWFRSRATWLFIATALSYWLFFETLVWLNYTTLEVRFLMYPALPLMMFWCWGIGILAGYVRKYSRWLPIVVLLFMVAFDIQGGLESSIKGMRYLYNSYASQHEVADELAQIIPAHQPTDVLAYTGVAGALDYFARQHGLDLTFNDFRFAPDDAPERYITDHQLRFVIHPRGNAFAKAKFPYLAQFETQTHNGVTFRPLTQFATTLDNQMWSIWALEY